MTGMAFQFNSRVFTFMFDDVLCWTVGDQMMLKDFVFYHFIQNVYLVVLHIVTPLVLLMHLLQKVLARKSNSCNSLILVPLQKGQ